MLLPPVFLPMTLDLLDAPLRVSWDLHDDAGPMPSAVARPIVHSLGAADVFFVTLDRRPLAHPSIVKILADLDGQGCRTVIICQATQTELSRLNHDLRCHALFLDADAFVADRQVNFQDLQKTLGTLRECGQAPDLLLTPRRNNFFLIPELIDFCRSEGVGKFKLPNTRYDASLRHSRGEQLLRPEDLHSLDRLLEGDAPARRNGVTLEVHDLFLWELFYPGRDEGRSEYGGCQAANSLGHVDAAGNLFPCSSWPDALGSLLESSLTDLWDSPLRHDIRRTITCEPSGCVGCRDFSLCLGGCRGLAKAFSQQCGGRDPSCHGPR